jgi:zinc protease
MKIIIKAAVILLFSILVLTCAVTSSVNYGGLGAGTDKVPFTNRALTGVLPNGLRYFILENSLPENRAHVALVVNAGSVLERDDQRGFAHFVEHMAFKGTARFPEMELIDYLRSLGMRFGPDANAYTSYDETVYHFDVPVEIVDGIKRIPDRALAILDDWTYAISFNPADVESESRVILEELRARLGAMDRVRKITLPVLFYGSAYAEREPIGLAHIIENADSCQLREFYERWYTSDNMALVFIGDFDGRTLEAELTDHFNMPAATQPVNRPVHTLPPPKDGNFHVQIITDPELTSSSYLIYYKQRQGAQKGTISYYREIVIDYLIRAMLTKRFDDAANDPSSSAISSWGGIWRWSLNTKFYSMGTQPKTGNTEQALKELLLEIESIKRFGFTETELAIAKLNLIAHMERLLSEKDRMESRRFIRSFTSHFLYGDDMADIEWEVNAVSSMLPGIGLREILQAARNYFSANDINVFLIAPKAEEENLPDIEQIKSIFREAQNAQLSPRQEIPLLSDLMNRIPIPGEIISEKTDEETGALVIGLSNGANVILKQTENRNNEIILYAMARGGTNNMPEEHAVSVRLASEMINVSGIGPHTRMELVNKLAGKQVSASFWASTSYRGFQGSSTTQDIKTLFELIYLFFTEPKLDERAVSAMIDQYRTNLIHQDDDPQSALSREVTRIIFNNHPRYRPFELADMDKISLDHVYNFILNCLNPQDYTFVFTGNLDIEQMRKFAANYLASIPNLAESSLNEWVSPEITRPGKTESILYKGQDERCIVFLIWFAEGSEIFDEQKNQVAAILSEYLRITLNNEIRENLGGVYSISSGVSVSVIPVGEYSLSVFFHCDPARVYELIDAVKESIIQITTKPLNIDTFNMAKEAMLMGHERSIQQNLHIAQSYANSSVLFDTPLNRLNMRPYAIRAVTAGDVQEFCTRILNEGPVMVIMFPKNWD